MSNRLHQKRRICRVQNSDSNMVFLLCRTENKIAIETADHDPKFDCLNAAEINKDRFCKTISSVAFVDT